jgi:hypothetical protein
LASITNILVFPYKELLTTSIKYSIKRKEAGVKAHTSTPAEEHRRKDKTMLHNRTNTTNGTISPATASALLQRLIREVDLPAEVHTDLLKIEQSFSRHVLAR